MRMEMDSLMRRGGVYFSVYDREGQDNLLSIVMYFDDAVLDLMAEILEVNCRMSNYNIMTEFKCFASDMFDQFNAR